MKFAAKPGKKLEDSELWNKQMRKFSERSAEIKKHHLGVTRRSGARSGSLSSRPAVVLSESILLVPLPATVAVVVDFFTDKYAHVPPFRRHPQRQKSLTKRCLTGSLLCQQAFGVTSLDLCQEPIPIFHRCKVLRPVAAVGRPRHGWML